MELLGILVDTGAEKILLPPKKTENIAGAAASLLQYAAFHLRHARRRDVKRFGGLANCCELAVVNFRLHLHEIFFEMFTSCTEREERSQSPQRRRDRSEIACRGRSGAKAFARSNEHGVCGSPGVGPQKLYWGLCATRTAAQEMDIQFSDTKMRDFQWWRSFPTKPHVGRDIWPQHDAKMFLDVSM